MNVLVDFSEEMVRELDRALVRRLAERGGSAKRRRPTEAELREAERLAEEAGSAKKGNDYLAQVTALGSGPRPSRRALIVEAVEAWLAAQRK